MQRRPLSELEGCVLGLIELAGSTTAYAVCDEFLRSASPQWSGSAGAIYPLMRRLERDKMISGVSRSVGRRKHTLFSLTAAGRASLTGWLSTSVPDRVVGVPPDPVRTRIHFLDVLPRAKRLAFVRSALKGAHRNLSKVRAECQRSKVQGGVPYWVARGALYTMEARCKWLRQIQQILLRGAEPRQ